MFTVQNKRICEFYVLLLLQRRNTAKMKQINHACDLKFRMIVVSN